MRLSLKDGAARPVASYCKTPRQSAQKKLVLDRYGKKIAVASEFKWRYELKGREE